MLNLSQAVTFLRKGAALGIFLALTPGVAHAQVAVYNFENLTQTDPISGPASLGDNVSGRSILGTGATGTELTFSSASSTFTYADNNPPAAGGDVFGSNLSNYVVSATGGNVGDTLTLTFSNAITNLSLNFATSEANAFTLTTGGQTFTSGAVETFDPNDVPDPTTPGTFFGAYKGTLNTGTLNPFTTIVLTLNTPTIASAFDNVTVTLAPAAVPEPGVVGFAAATLLTGAGLLRRKRRA